MARFTPVTDFADYEVRKFLADVERHTARHDQEPSPEEYALEDEFQDYLAYEAALAYTDEEVFA